eukprot:Platyproteum_vivax@DN7109_c0_g1_i1.p1
MWVQKGVSTEVGANKKKPEKPVEACDEVTQEAGTKGEAKADGDESNVQNEVEDGEIGKDETAVEAQETGAKAEATEADGNHENEVKEAEEGEISEDEKTPPDGEDDKKAESDEEEETDNCEVLWEQLLCNRRFGTLTIQDPLEEFRWLKPTYSAMERMSFELRFAAETMFQAMIKEHEIRGSIDIREEIFLNSPTKWRGRFPTVFDDARTEIPDEKYFVCRNPFLIPNGNRSEYVQLGMKSTYPPPPPSKPPPPNFGRGRGARHKKPYTKRKEEHFLPNQLQPQVLEKRLPPQPPVRIMQRNVRGENAEAPKSILQFSAGGNLSQPPPPPPLRPPQTLFPTNQYVHPLSQTAHPPANVIPFRGRGQHKPYTDNQMWST